MLVLLSYYQGLMLLCDAFYSSAPFITSVSGLLSGFLIISRVLALLLLCSGSDNPIGYCYDANVLETF